MSHSTFTDRHRLTCRLLSLAVAVATAVVVPVIGVGSTEAVAVPHEVRVGVRSVPLVAQSAERAARLGAVGASESSVVETGGDLRVVGVTWPKGEDADRDRVEIRERAAGTWGPWALMDPDDDHRPDPGSPEALRSRGGTEAFLTMADAIQVRVMGEHPSTGRGARLDVIDPRTSSADRAAGTAGTATAGSVRPTILSRERWGADERLKRGTPSFGVVKAAVVHHTAGSNSYTADQVPAILRGIYGFHVNGRGWSDVGYNFLIDKFGRIWEGRAGGVDQAVVGAQAGGFNSQTFGVSTLGDFSSVSPSSAAVTALSKLTAWKLGLSQVDPTARTVIDGKGTLPTVIGHRDLNDTSCPGAEYQTRFPGIRTSARTYQGTMVYQPALSATSLPYGSGSATLTARASTSLGWTLSVTSVCRTSAQFVRTGTANSTIPVSATWSGRLADGTSAPPGEYLLTLTARSGSGTAATAPQVVRSVVVKDAVGAPAGFCPKRLAGADRYATSVAVSREHKSSTKTIVLASGEESAMADALVAAPLARAKGAALLLTPAGGLSGATRSELVRTGANTAYLVGGTGAISQAVEDELSSIGIGDVVRVSGRDRYATAAAVATALGGPRREATVASGLQTAIVDGLALSGPAAHLGRPILLVARDHVPSPTRTALSALGTTSTVVAGGSGVVSDEVVATLPGARRLAGASRYKTAVAVASWAASIGVPLDVVVASGEEGSLIDMVSAGQLGRITLMTQRTAMPIPISSWLFSASGLRSVVVVGGVGVVSESVGGIAQQALLE